MKTEWDYTELADAYLLRPDYAEDAIDALIKLSGAKPGAAVCDVGAGTGHLTKLLAKRGFTVTAVEPNDAMRRNGINVTKDAKNVRWAEGTGEQTGQASGAYQLVTFGSSFNVTDRQLALKESARLLAPRGWFACMWNHRDLDDPVQRKIEEIIAGEVPSYQYGTRREDQTEVIGASKLFGPVQRLEGRVLHEQSIEACVEAWRSHATLNRQAGKAFATVVSKIEAYLTGLKKPALAIPYTTRIWAAQKL